jgi:hypothetical protein
MMMQGHVFDDQAPRIFQISKKHPVVETTVRGMQQKDRAGSQEERCSRAAHGQE